MNKHFYFLCVAASFCFLSPVSGEEKTCAPAIEITREKLPRMSSEPRGEGVVLETFVVWSAGHNLFTINSKNFQSRVIRLLDADEGFISDPIRCGNSLVALTNKRTLILDSKFKVFAGTKIDGLPTNLFGIEKGFVVSALKKPNSEILVFNCSGAKQFETSASLIQKPWAVQKIASNYALLTGGPSIIWLNSSLNFVKETSLPKLKDITAAVAWNGKLYLGDKLGQISSIGIESEKSLQLNASEVLNIYVRPDALVVKTKTNKLVTVDSELRMLGSASVPGLVEGDAAESTDALMVPTDSGYVSLSRDGKVKTQSIPKFSGQGFFRMGQYIFGRSQDGYVLFDLQMRPLFTRISDSDLSDTKLTVVGEHIIAYKPRFIFELKAESVMKCR